MLLFDERSNELYLQNYPIHLNNSLKSPFQQRCSFGKSYKLQEPKPDCHGVEKPVQNKHAQCHDDCESHTVLKLT